MINTIHIDPPEPDRKGRLGRWWDGHCGREQVRNAERDETSRAEKVQQAYIDICDNALPEERAAQAVADIDQYAMPVQAIEAARLAISRCSTSLGNGPKLSAEWSERFTKTLLIFEKELEDGKEVTINENKTIRVYADIPSETDSAPGADGNA
jgi:uncharacterized protein (DUF2344 family)